AEVELLLDAGVPDVLWAHQPVGPAKVSFAVAAAAGGALTVAVDSLDVARPLSVAADATGVELPYLLEVEAGTGRSGVEPQNAVELAEALAKLPGLRLRGVFTHEGFLARYGSDRAALEDAARAAAAIVAGTAERLRAAGHPVEIVSMGSTPGLTSAPRVSAITEARPGTYIYFDGNQLNLRSTTPERCALTVLTRVVSRQRAGTAIVDAGIKALSSDRSNAGEGHGVVCDASGAVVAGLQLLAAHEEHGFVTGPAVEQLRVGDLLRIIPNHACGTVNMWSSVVVLGSDGRARERWAVEARH
ncbi:MAG: alanine racemase, partial [Actinomycetes bacterium]